ncbi:MAG TPA: tRNA (guanosine(46)-N7)-methyltransferase TrmB [Gemmataceae bacterium]
MRKPKRLPPEQLAPYIYELPPSPEPPGHPVIPSSRHPVICKSRHPLDWSALFGNDRPVEVEVGFGKGTFLVHAAQARPETNFFGIEIERKYYYYAASRAARRNLRNVRVCCADAKVFLRDHVADGSVEVVHVYFPDPWWKRRHWKRRLFTPDFAATCARILRAAGPAMRSRGEGAGAALAGPAMRSRGEGAGAKEGGGRLSIATDVEEYFGVMTGIVGAMPQFRQLPLPSADAPPEGEDYMTNFERKARLQGRPVFRAVYERVEPAGAAEAAP